MNEAIYDIPNAGIDLFSLDSSEFQGTFRHETHMVTIRISNDENGNLTYSLLIAETSRFSCSTILSVTMSLTAAGAISEHTVPSQKTLSTSDRSFDSKGNEEGVLSDERDIATNVISVDDDASLNPWTIRAFFIGLGLSAFGGVLGELL
jgi:hypothetical protein